jgi:hypothetical protein
MSQRAILSIAFLLVALPVWFGFAWAIGLLRFGHERAIERAPVFEQATALDAEDLHRCLMRDYSGGLTLHPADSSAPQTSRLRNHSGRIVVDIDARGDGAVVRVYRLDSAPLPRSQLLAVQSCIPENGLPNPIDPANRDFYGR